MHNEHVLSVSFLYSTNCGEWLFVGEISGEINGFIAGRSYNSKIFIALFCFSSSTGFCPPYLSKR
jgi:hypothetical protein